jgi:hypothetical protein
VEKLLRHLGVRITAFEKYQVNVYFSISKKLTCPGFFYKALGGCSGGGTTRALVALPEDKVYESGKNLWSEAGVQESVYTFIISS